MKDIGEGHGDTEQGECLNAAFMGAIEKTGPMGMALSGKCLNYNPQRYNYPCVYGPHLHNAASRS